MAFGLTMGTERATALQGQIENELVKRGLGTEPGECGFTRAFVPKTHPAQDNVMAEYVTIMVINNKTPGE